MKIPCVILMIIIIYLLNVSHSQQSSVCIIGSGISGSSLSHFLHQYNTNHNQSSIHVIIFERNDVVGGRMSTVTINNETFEAGASILHPKNYHTLNFTKSLNLKPKVDSDDDSSDRSSSFGIWDGDKFVVKSFKYDSNFPFVKRIVSLINDIYMFIRYGFSLLRMDTFVHTTVDRFLKYYESRETRPVFETVEEMLKWAGLYNLTQRTLREELRDARLNSLLIDELVTTVADIETRFKSSRAAPVKYNALSSFISVQEKVKVITRINYGQSCSISGLAGAVSLAGSDAGLWAVEGGNWQMAAGLINRSDVELHLREEIKSVTFTGDYYELNSTAGNSYTCEVAVVATPLDESDIQFTPSISIPERKLQHTHTIFVRGLLNPVYFGLGSTADIPDLIGTLEDPKLPFSSISILKQHDEKDATYKIFSRQFMEEALLDSIFSVRNETIRIDWAAYPQYQSPEVFAPFILDGRHLYYVNAFESGASTMETSAVAAENVARLILSRYFTTDVITKSKTSASSDELLHLDL
ncbi:hypothetical protein ACFE04_012046 [Oxalis oulophora]